MIANMSAKTKNWILAGGLVLAAILLIRGTIAFLMSFGSP